MTAGAQARPEVPEPRWLDDAQQATWRRYLLGNALLHERLDRDLRETHGISSAEYEVLVRLSEAADHTLRMAELAEMSNQSRSRLSHTVDRMQRAGLVARHYCDTDRRGVWADLTDEGMRLLREAARTHVAGVREYLVDAVSPDDYAAAGRVFQAIVDRLAPESPGLAGLSTEAVEAMCGQVHGTSTKAPQPR